MCKLVEYLVEKAIIMITLSLTLYQFYCLFHIDIESESPYPLTSSSHFLAIVSSSSSVSIVTSTPVPPGI